MSVVFEKVFLLIVLASAGFALCKAGIADHKHAKLLSVLEVYLFLPANTLKTYSVNFFTGAVIGLTGIPLPAAITSTLEKTAACILPVSMVLTGMVVSEFDIRTLLRRKSDYIVVLCRLFLFPCAIAGALKLLGLDDVVIPALMMYAMPCGMNTIIVPRLIGEDCESGAALALISNLLACVTIPVCVFLFT